MLMKLCPKCGTPINIESRYCDKCSAAKQSEKKQSNRIYDKKRDKKYYDFYRSSEWLRARSLRLQMDGYKCVDCWKNGKLEPASDVHHNIPIKTPEGWKHRLDVNLMRSLCKACHNRQGTR